MWYVGGRMNIHTEFQRENLKEKDYLEDLDLDVRILKFILQKQDEMA
jgi:hypothetical protein